MLKQRLITVAVILPLLLGLILFAPMPLWGAVAAAAAAVGALEWARLLGFGRRARGAMAFGVLLSCAALLAAAVLDAAWRSIVVNSVYGLALVFWVVAVPAWLHFRWRVSSIWLLVAAGWLVLVPAWLAITLLQQIPAALLLILGAVWIADTAAYFAGRRFGRHKLAPEISPGKTIEGAVAAFVAVALYSAAIGEFLLPGANPADRLALLLFGAMLTAFSIAGDLFESWMKRQAGAKDSGDILPGHGGVLDRIDSMTAALPFAALFLARFAA